VIPNRFGGGYCDANQIANIVRVIDTQEAKHIHYRVGRVAAVVRSGQSPSVTRLTDRLWKEVTR
jgi:hypothetical protein